MLNTGDPTSGPMIEASIKTLGLDPKSIKIMINGHGHTPMDSMPLWLQYAMVISPAPHFVSISQAILYRGAGWDAVWPDAIALSLIGILFFVGALMRFRRALAEAR